MFLRSSAALGWGINHTCTVMHAQKSNCDLIAPILPFLFNGALHVNYTVFAYFMKAAK